MFEVAHGELEAVKTEGLARAALELLVAELSRVEAHAAERRLAATAAIDALDDGGLGGADVTRVKAKKSAKGSKKAAKTAAALRRMPKTRAKLARGEINEEHADAAADAADRVSPEAADELADRAATRPADLFAEGEPIVGECARARRGEGAARGSSAGGPRGHDMDRRRRHVVPVRQVRSRLGPGAPQGAQPRNRPIVASRRRPRRSPRRRAHARAAASRRARRR